MKNHAVEYLYTKFEQMLFDPFTDYASLNLQKPENLACYRFSEIIKGLVTLKSTAKRQQEIIGIGEATTEMAEDFNGHLNLGMPLFMEYNLAGDKLLERLHELGDYMYSHNPSDIFWDTQSLYNHKGWDYVRQTARQILIDMGYGSLELSITREDFFKELHGKQYLTGQRTVLRLI